MCDLDSEYTTVTGPRGVVQNISSLWGSELETPRRYAGNLGEFHVLHLGSIDGIGNDMHCPAVGILYHPADWGHAVAHQLQIELGTVTGGQVICEPGFTVRAAGAPPGGRANVSVDYNKIRTNLSTTGATTTKVAVLDSGDSPSAATNMVDFVGLSPTNPSPQQSSAPYDGFGHGEAVCEVIRTIRPGAAIEPVRVLNDNGAANSFELFLALTYCLWQGRFNLVNASLSNPGKGPCANSLGATIMLIQQLCMASGGPMPTLIAAAGNTPDTKKVAYPALVTGAVVVTATDWQGNDPGYNASTAGTVNQVVPQVGGTKTDSFGHFTDTAGNRHEMYGTSFAAAVETANRI